MRRQSSYVCGMQVGCLKGELNVDKKWQSDDLFYIIMNESRPRVDQLAIVSNYKEIVMY